MSNLQQNPIKPATPDTLETEHNNRPTFDTTSATVPFANLPSPEVTPKAKRRRLTSEYKLRILEELDRCTGPGEKGAILRREGIYSSSTTEWRRARDTGALGALDKVRGRKPKHDHRDNQITKLEAELLQLKKKFAQAEAVIEVQKKVCEIFGVSSPNSENDGRNS